MKKLIFILLLWPALAYGQWVTDSLGNNLKFSDWTLFDVEHQFHHPNGNWYPSSQTGGICWVYTAKYRQNNFRSLMTVGGFSWGIYDAVKKDYFDNWQSWDNVGRFWTRFGGGWLWGNALDNPNPYAVRNAGAITGAIWSINQAHNFDLSWQRGPTWGETGIILGELITPPLIGWALDKIRHIPSSKPAYRYTIRCRR